MKTFYKLLDESLDIYWKGTLHEFASLLAFKNAEQLISRHKLMQPHLSSILHIVSWFKPFNALPNLKKKWQIFA